MTTTKRPACADKDPELFYPSEHDQHSIIQARAICARCPLADPCLKVAMDLEGDVNKHLRHGIWAGTTPGERARKARQRETVIRDICGTYAGSQAHYKWYETQCEPCRAAGNEKRRVDKAANKKAKPVKRAPECGTTAAYYHHQRNSNTPVCQPCRDAFNDAQGARMGTILTDRRNVLELLVETGGNLDDALPRINISRNGLHTWCTRNGALDLYDVLSRRSQEARVA